jgi:transcriptional regulator with PAS, ATPase and Fis domain
LFERVKRMAMANAAVLIEGETGSGKEIIARALHHFSMRSSRPWVDVNCAALPEHLVESELFGYEKGAFSGANASKPGLFEMAESGTLFLDEIGELDSRLQVKLLRVLDGVGFYRLGGVKKVSVNVRIVAATNRNLEQEVAQGRFRKDLYHRLSQLVLRVPPLRERPDDIVPIAQLFLEQQNPDLDLSAEAQRILRSHRWPGNVRELQNVMIYCATMAAGPMVGRDDLPPALLGYAPLVNATLDAAGVSPMDPYRPAGPGEGPGPLQLDDMEKRAILQVLEQTGGHRERAARVLGISSRTLSRKLKAYNMQLEPVER